MGNIFANNTIRTPNKRPFVNARREKYLSEKKDPKRAPNEKRELKEQIEYCEWFKSVLPSIHFRADTAAGEWNNKFVKNQDTQQRSAKGLPDITIYAARHGYHGLLIEFKATGESLYKKRDGTKIIVKTKKVPISRKHPTGIKVLERDYKIRMKGDWKDIHTERQHDRHVELQKEGYLSVFALGLEAAKEITCRYFDLAYTTPVDNGELF